MEEIRFHGRGGQGAVTAAMILAVGAFKDGKYTQAFPKFGVERRGAPVEAFTRISEDFIRRKSQVYEPNYLVVLDSTLFGAVDITAGLKEGGMVIVNTNQSPEDLGLKGLNVKTLDVSKLALDMLGRDIVNTAMLGAFGGFTGLVSLEGLFAGVDEHFSGSLAEKNKKLVEEVYNQSKK
ncbi:MAG: pyruvate ferredoxin oxidoreductase subunit gamma [Candidatus Altiarchaeales archaeon]|nr:pyruvate ferredoxin oxidoreductase subunit gamma [Candidatus Altiarchaeales archaeon]MBD3416691.1 pyruvate ferredoxin oxidoreductase subunit gamma [Candidatus Altiarchaeales archaeon]